MRQHAILRWIWIVLTWILLAGCVVTMPNAATSESITGESAELIAAEAAAKGMTPEQLLLLAQLPSKGQAPELTNEVWFNTESHGGGALELADLRGNVVIVEFWTYG
ncbi:MAG: hypothetical protein AAF702_20720 [Chloroflexota bacterium]